MLVRGGSKVALNGALAGVYNCNVVYREVLILVVGMGFFGVSFGLLVFF